MEKSDCKRSWVGKDNTLAYCPIHNQYFYINRGSKACKFYTLTSDGTSKNEKSHSSSFTSESQVNTSESQAVTSNSQVNRRKYVRKHKIGIWERFHNYGIKFTAEVQWDALFKCEEIQLRNNVSYKRVDLPNAIVKVFKKSILIVLRSRKEIVGLQVKDAERQAVDMMLDTIKKLPSAIKVKDSDIASIHNAFVNHPTAKLFKDAFGREMNIKDENGATHIITDNSHHNHELEYINKDTAIDGSVYREDYEGDIFFKKPPMPSVVANQVVENTKDIRATIDVLNAVKDEALIPLTNQLKLHLGVEDKQDKNMDLMNVNLAKQNELLEKQNKILESRPTSSKESSQGVVLPTLSRYSTPDDVVLAKKKFKLFKARSLKDSLGC